MGETAKTVVFLEEKKPFQMKFCKLCFGNPLPCFYFFEIKQFKCFLLQVNVIHSLEKLLILGM